MRQLEDVEVVAGEQGEDAVEAGEFVDGEGETDEFGCGGEGDYVEEGLGSLVRVRVLWEGRGLPLGVGSGGGRAWLAIGG